MRCMVQGTFFIQNNNRPYLSGSQIWGIVNLLALDITYYHTITCICENPTVCFISPVRCSISRLDNLEQRCIAFMFHVHASLFLFPFCNRFPGFKWHFFLRMPLLIINDIQNWNCPTLSPWKLHCHTATKLLFPLFSHQQYMNLQIYIYQ